MAGIMIVLIIEKGETPAIFLEKESIDFASRIGEEIQWVCTPIRMSVIID